MGRRLAPHRLELLGHPHRAAAAVADLLQQLVAIDPVAGLLAWSGAGVGLGGLPGAPDALRRPLFVDLDDPQLPVFTAMHGAGVWAAEQISESLAACTATGQEFSRLSDGRDGMDREDHSLSRSERKALPKMLRRISPRAKPDFGLRLFDVD